MAEGEIKRHRNRSTPLEGYAYFSAEKLLSLAPSRSGHPSRDVLRFRQIVWRHYRKFGRHDLPWRPPSLKLRKGKKSDILYKILVSEVMLQQTQVERVIPFYTKFIEKFPTAKKLAVAPLSEVLRIWQGLGYNRRAKLLREAATRFPRFDLKSEFSRSNLKNSNLVAELEKLPGVGPYTARAVAVFAYNQDVIVIETNIRTAVIHHFFPKKRKVSDKEIEKILIAAHSRGRAYEWYSALMDYGAYLKKSGIKLNTKHANYTKQKKFAGSNREARGAILRALASQGDSSQRSVTLRNLLNLLGSSRRTQLRTALVALESEGLIKKSGNRFSLAD